jgi:hypothetical protein
VNKTPKFVAHPEEVHYSRVAKNCQQNGNKKQVKKRNAKKHAPFGSQIFDVCMKGFVPKLRAARAPDETLLRPFGDGHTPWTDGAAAARQEPIEVSKLWEELVRAQETAREF